MVVLLLLTGVCVVCVFLSLSFEEGNYKKGNGGFEELCIGDRQWLLLTGRETPSSTFYCGRLWRWTPDGTGGLCISFWARQGPIILTFIIREISSLIVVFSDKNYFTTTQNFNIILQIKKYNL